jgi:hypothetical protein
MGGLWWAAVPDEDWPRDPESLAIIEKNWDDKFGDCRQELVIIGMDMDEAALRARFDACLLTDEEMALGPNGWEALADPFPSWGNIVDEE